MITRVKALKQLLKAHVIPCQRKPGSLALIKDELFFTVMRPAFLQYVVGMFFATVIMVDTFM